MAGNGTKKRLQVLEQEYEQHMATAGLLCADTLAEWEKWQRAAGDPGGLVAQAEAAVAQYRREALEAWQTTAAPAVN